MKRFFFRRWVIHFIVVAFLCLNAFGTGFAEEFRGVEFPQGSVSFADAVVSYAPGSGVSAPYNNPERALGIPDYISEEEDRYVSLEDEGVLILRFTDNSLTTSGDDANDLWVFEIGGSIEPTSVAISTNGMDWIDVGDTGGAISGIDIDAFIGAGVVAGEKYSFVKLIDLLPHQSNTPWTGADIDAVGAISSAPPVITCEDSDGDGVADHIDKCPNTPPNSWVNKEGCPASGFYTQEQVDQIIASILTWGDTNGDKKIGLAEAIHALQVSSGVTEPAIK